MTTRLYSLFERNAVNPNRWDRISLYSLPLIRARVVWQNELLRQVLVGDCRERALRPVPRKP